MHIVQMGTFPFPSFQGSQVYVNGIVQGLMQRGHRVSLLCYGHGVGQVDPSIEIHRTPQIFGYQNMRAGPDWTKPWLDLRMVYNLIKLDPDVIHVHNYEAPFVVWMTQILSKHHRKIPVVYSAHNTMKDELPTYFSKGWLKKGMSKIGKQLDLHVPKKMDCCVVLREESIEKMTLLGCQNVRWVSPGIDPKEFDSHECTDFMCKPEWMKGKQWIIYAGNPDQYQDLDILMDVMNALPEIGLIFISGSDSSQWQRQRGIIQRIHSSNFQEIQQYLRWSDMAVITRQNCTGFPIKLLNYAACGLVTVCAQGSYLSIPSVLKVPNGDIPQTIAMVKKILANPELREELGNEGQQFVLKNLTWQEQAAKLEEIYLELLD